MKKIVIHVGSDYKGYTFQLSPASREFIQQQRPQAHPVTSVFVSYDDRQQFERRHGPVVEQVVLILTGLTERQLKKLGGYRIIDPVTKKPLLA